MKEVIAMKKYEKPILELLEFAKCDIVTTSAVNEADPWDSDIFFSN